MKHTGLDALSPVDGRYLGKTQALRRYFSEEALIGYRVRVEIAYLFALLDTLPSIGRRCTDEQRAAIAAIATDFSITDAERVKDIESVTNHDVKAVEYFIKEQFDRIGGLEWLKEFVHFGLTSQDINNTAFPLMLREALEEVYLPAFDRVVTKMDSLAREWAEVPMLARTHGQPASPTRMGKEIAVFVYRLRQQHAQLLAIPHTAKFGGATGNFNAHHVAYPQIDWIDFGNRFVASLGLVREQLTTQISNYDCLAALFDTLARIHTIFIDFARDVWTYVSMGYFRQRVKAGEVGSSAMPHKVNPIDFENAEGNLGIANALLHHLAAKLPISRLQRDLTDSTVLRNEGMPLAYGLIALSSLEKGLEKIILNEERLCQDLESNYEVVAEAIQTILRREGYPNPYETLKALTRTGVAVNKETIAAFVETLEVSEDVKAELRSITPHNYVGI